MSKSSKIWFYLLLWTAGFSIQGAVLRERHDLVSSAVTAITNLAVDDSGFIYELGTTAWPDFPTTPGPFSRFTGSRGFTNLTGDVFIRKLSPDGRQVVFSVLIGGSGDEKSAGIAVDRQGNIFVTGTTDSADFPVTILSIAPSNRSTAKVFVFQLNSDGTELVHSRLLGGSGFDEAKALSLTSDGRVVIAGATTSNDFPTTANAVQRARATAPTSAFLVRLSGGDIDYATYLSGPGGSSGEDVAVDENGDMYVTGFAGPFFPTLATSYAPQLLSGGFVSKIDHVNGQFVYSTYLPGVAVSLIGPFPRMAIRVDSKRHAYVAGPASVGFPATAGSFQTETASNPFVRYPAVDAFVLELDASGEHLVFATLYGASNNDHARALAITGDTVTIAGLTSSSDLPYREFGLPTCNLFAVQYTFDEPYTSFVAQFDHTGKLITSLQFGSCNGDQIETLVPISSGLLLAGTYNHLRSSFTAIVDLAAPAPVHIEAIVDAASLQLGPSAPLEMITIFGSGLGPKATVHAKPINGFYPTTLAGTQLLVQGQPAPLISVASDRITAVLPGQSYYLTEVRATSSAGTSPSLTTIVTSVAPGLFTIDGTGQGQARAVNHDKSANSPATPGALGSNILFYGTGGGLANHNMANGQIATDLAPLLAAPYVFCTIGGKPAKVSYIGAAPGEVNGIFQAEVTIPDDAPVGAEVPVILRILGYRTQRGVTIAVRQALAEAKPQD